MHFNKNIVLDNDQIAVYDDDNKKKNIFNKISRTDQIRVLMQRME